MFLLELIQSRTAKPERYRGTGSVTEAAPVS